MAYGLTATIAGAKLPHARSTTRARPVRLYRKAGSIAEFLLFVVLSAETCTEEETVSQECEYSSWMSLETSLKNERGMYSKDLCCSCLGTLWRMESYSVGCSKEWEMIHAS